jgi:hypothetical protein
MRPRARRKQYEPCAAVYLQMYAFHWREVSGIASMKGQNGVAGYPGKLGY